jgi:hypothetical protein
MMEYNTLGLDRIKQVALALMQQDPGLAACQEFSAYCAQVRHCTW